MDKWIGKLKDKKRYLVLLIFTAVTNGYLTGFVDGKIFNGRTKALCVPGLNCYSCPGALGSCPLGSLQAVLGSRKYSFSFYLVGFFMLVGAVFGRFICGWLCPFGLVQDLLFQIPFVKKLRKLPGDKWLRFLKYFLLVFFVILLPLFVVDISGQGKPWFCEYVCPSGTLLAGIPLVLANEGLRDALGFLFAWKALILAVIVLLSIVVYRPFCRYICPLGAIYGFFNPIAFYRFRVDESKCNGCGGCRKSCKLDIPVWEKPNSMECIRCGDCLKACPQGAIQSTFSKKTGEKRKKQ